MKRGSLTLRTMVALRAAFPADFVGSTQASARALEELDAAIARLSSTKKVAARRMRRLEKSAKALEHRIETSDLYHKAKRRAGGRCEMCGLAFTDFDPPQLDHAIARGKAHQRLSTVWMIHMLCHRRKHASDPAWLEAFHSFALSHGYTYEMRWAEGQLARAKAHQEFSGVRQ